MSCPNSRIRNNGNLALKYKVNITASRARPSLTRVIEWTIGDVALGTEQHLAVGGENEFTVKGHMLESAGNDYMNLTIDGIGITVVATQDTVESDSFGKTYDADAVYPIDSADSLKKSLDEVNASETVDDAVFTMGGNFEYSDETFEVAPGKNVTIDLAGKNLTLTNKLPTPLPSPTAVSPFANSETAESSFSTATQETATEFSFQTPRKAKQRPSTSRVTLNLTLTPRQTPEFTPMPPLARPL